MNPRLGFGVCILILSLTPAWAQPAGPRFEITYPATLGPGPFDGRVLLLISDKFDTEPRLAISDTSLKTQLVFGIDVLGWKPGDKAIVDGSVLGFPLESLRELPAGTYNVQALLHKYETFRRADGHVVKLPMDRGEGQQWNRAPGNLLSTPRKIELDPKGVGPRRHRPRPGDPAHHPAEGHEVRPPRADPQRAALEVLGPGHAPGGGAPPALRLRRAPAGALPPGDQPRPLPAHPRRLARGAARPQPEARLLRPLPVARATTARSRNGRTSSTRTGPLPASRA